jgi:hypothetical protein
LQFSWLFGDVDAHERRGLTGASGLEGFKLVKRAVEMAA